jgi:translation elongation factor EF-4
MLDEVQKVLSSYVLKTEVLKGIPILFVLNKQDVVGAISEEQMTAELNLSKLVEGRESKVLQASAKTGNGIPDMLRWILEQIKMKKGEGA